MRMKKIPVRMLAILLVCMTVLLSVCLELLSVPAMAAEEKAACYTVRIANLEHGSIALKEDDNLQAGNQIHLQVTPQEGYHLASLTVATSDGTALAVTDTDGAAVTDGAYPDTMLIVMPEDDVTVTGAFVSENDAADTAVSDTVLPEEIFSMTGADTPLAATMNSAERAISRAASSATLIKYENQFSCYHKDGSWDCTESYLMLGNQLAWCIEPSVNIGASGGTYGLNGDAAQWLMDKYGWSYKKTNNLTKAVYLAKSYYGNDWLCSYVLVQNLIWSEIKENESPANYGRYVLTDGARNTAHNCGHLNTKAKVDAAIADVWTRFYSYNKLPSFDGWTVYATAGQSYWLKDTNGVVNDTSFVGQTGVTVSKGWDGSNVGIWIGSNASMAGKSTTIHYYKNAIPNSSEPFLIYTRTGHQSVSTWTSAITPTYGAIRVVFTRTSYLRAHYKAREKVAPSLDIHITKADSDTGAALAGAEFTVSMDGKQVATVTTDADGKAAYHWRGNVLWTDYAEAYEPVLDYKNWSSAYNKAKQSVLASVSDKLKTLKEGTTHTWKVEEVKAPDGYERNEEVWEQTFSLNTHAVEIDFTDEPEKGFLTLKKASSDEAFSKENDCYNLKGAVYGVYQSVEDAIQDANRVETLTTKEDGSSNTVTLRRGTYYVKELTASDGYLLCNEQEENLPAGIHAATVKSLETTTVSCKEEPASNPFDLSLQKLDLGSHSAEAPGNAALSGAIFEIAYYENVNGATDGTSAKKWYYRTDETGTFSATDKEDLLTTYQMQDGRTLQSDDLYEHDGAIAFPIGTYTCKEISAPVHYQLSGIMYFTGQEETKTDVTTGLKLVIRQEKNGVAPQIYQGEVVGSGSILAENPKIEAYDETQYGSITIYKKSANEKQIPLSGVSFRLVGVDEGDEHIASTDADGKICWEGLIPQDYVITEIKTADGKNLLKDNITVTLPMELTVEEAQQRGADLSQAVWDEAAQKYCFYDLTFEIGNSAVLTMPMTGGNTESMYVLMIVGILAAVGGIALLERNRKKNHVN